MNKTIFLLLSFLPLSSHRTLHALTHWDSPSEDVVSRSLAREITFGVVVCSSFQLASIPVGRALCFALVVLFRLCLSPIIRSSPLEKRSEMPKRRIEKALP